MFLKIAFPNVSVCEWLNSVCEWVNSVWNQSIPRAFTNSYDLKYSRFYIQLHPSVSMKSDPNHIAVYHLWGYTYDLGENLWKLRCTVKCSRSTVIKLLPLLQPIISEVEFFSVKSITLIHNISLIGYHCVIIYDVASLKFIMNSHTSHLFYMFV